MRVTLDSPATDKPVVLRFQIELEFRKMLAFEERGKLGYPEKNLPEQGENQQQTQPTYVEQWVWESNLGHIGEMQVLSPLCQSLVPPSCILYARCNPFNYMTYTMHVPEGCHNHNAFIAL